MNYNKLGKTDIKVSELGFGAWSIALDWWGKKIEEDEAKRMLKKAYDLGINFFETGDMYGKGKSERIIGEVFKDMRDEVVLSTKYGYDFSEVEQIGHAELPQKFDEDFTKKALTKMVEEIGYKIVSCGIFRPATKSEGMRHKILKNSFPYYPRIMTDVHSGRDLRIILKNS